MHIIEKMMFIYFLCFCNIFKVLNGFYLPGIAPVLYCKQNSHHEKCETDIPLYVNRLNSEESVIPYDYDHFDFCTSSDDTPPVENLGQVVFGERIKPSPYKFKFREDVQCRKVCSKNYDFDREKDRQKMAFLQKGMSLDYHHHWIVDNMPVTWCYQLQEEGKGIEVYCATGFPFGCYMDKASNPKGACMMDIRYKGNDTYYIFNHVILNITYHSAKEEDWGADVGTDGGRILEINVTPTSISQSDRLALGCDIGRGKPLAIPAKLRGKLDFQRISNDTLKAIIVTCRGLVGLSTVAAELVNAVETASQGSATLDDGLQQALFHLAGYLARSVMKIHQCEACRDLLINQKEGERQRPSADDFRSFTDMLNQGKLLCPSEFGIICTKDFCRTYRAISKEATTRYALFGCTNPKRVFQQVASVLGENDDSLSSLTCHSGHHFLKEAYCTMSGALFNAFTSNYAKEVNSVVHASRKRTATCSVRQEATDKCKKLSGLKK